VTRRTIVSAVSGLVVGAATACGSGSDAVCLSSGAGEVCAERGDGRIEFSGSGLEPGSEVQIDNEELGPLTLTVDDDGSLDTAGTVGVVALFAGTEFIFIVTATDGRGEAIAGELTVST
jgi:hypothetical protein